MFEQSDENFSYIGDGDENTNNKIIAWSNKANLPQITIRAILVGLFIGSVVLVSNFQFGLQTGWVSMMSLPSALLGFAIFKISPYSRTFTDTENVFVQSVAVAVGTGPLAYGLIGIIPAIEKFLTKEESGLGINLQLTFIQLVIWSLGLAFFGVFFAVPLRKQVIINERLPFPSGSATATLISVLHGTEIYEEEAIIKESEIAKNYANKDCTADPSIGGGRQDTNLDTESIRMSQELKKLVDAESYRSNVKNLTYTFVLSASYTLLSYFIPILRSLPIFGNYLSKNYMWNFQPSPAYIGQGIIMGLPTVTYMLFGAILGWAILAPFAKSVGWAPGEIDNWISGGQGWILWISLSVMISDSLVSFVIIVSKSLSSGISNVRELNRRRNLYSESNAEMQHSLLRNDRVELRTYDVSSSDNLSVSRVSISSVSGRIDVDSLHVIGSNITIAGVLCSSFLCIIAVRLVFGLIIPYYATIIAIVLALFLSVMGVRALGETDLNPVSGIGKLSQLIFALVIPSNHPSKILINLIAGGIAEAGAQQAGDLMQDLKTGHLIGASPKAQFIAQLIGTIYSVFLSSIMYKVYNAVYKIPSDLFRIPTAIIWIDCSRLVTGDGLPPKAFEFCIFFGIIFATISLLKNITPVTSKYHKYLVYLPNGVAVGIGIYNTPNFTIARFIGGLIAYFWIHHRPQSQNGSDNKISMIIFSSGLVLGEGLLSGVTMILTSLGVKHF